ncbi:hypothetical protein KOI35_31545 [Actinoplanes bogorensis]|uniref:Phospholipase/carboxylesterase/thioesterase domain-containing protein n=1 Tax=Paractinoplanes bogorensis TaxID=1610840 RepID=A0ABS5Z0Y8_9ACTN|nr:hypothetical protein [Actinoplanes bogorensis]MBU2668055.1 hypothetical protein [Actinoplanes bogorensis]
MRDSIQVGATRRTYEIVGTPGPDLVIVFHGSKQNGAKHREFTGRAFDGLGSAVVYPDGYQGNWNDARRGSTFPARTDNVDDVGFTRALIGKLAPERVFVVGYSNGGQLVMRLVHEIPGLLAGAAVIAATMPAPENFLAAEAPPVPVPVLLVHGTKDPISRYAGGEFSWWARAAFKVSGRSLSMPETAAYFAARNGITASPAGTRLPAADAATSVERTDYRQDGHAPAVLYTVHGGGHTIPGPVRQPRVLGRTNQDVSTARLVDEFLAISRSPTG